jgi:hypothetical protein
MIDPSSPFAAVLTRTGTRTFLNCRGGRPNSFAAGATISGAASGDTGVISERVSECGPGTFVASLDSTTPTPRPITVRVARNDRPIAVEDVKLPRALPRTGTLRFSVPAGGYEVISSNREISQWVQARRSTKRRQLPTGGLPD